MTMECSKKTRVLVIYPEMMMGGSTTALLALLNGLDKEKYEVDLQLYKNRGPLLLDMLKSVIPGICRYM